jgi:hypothetical protein
LEYHWSCLFLPPELNSNISRRSRPCTPSSENRVP